jgi:hypothetical protein
VRVPAREIAPDSDLGELLVTRDVGKLSSHEIDTALDRGVRVAEELRERGLIHSAALCLQGHVRTTATVRHPTRMRIVSSPRSLPHA